MNPEDILPNENSQSQKDKHEVPRWLLKIIETENKVVGARHESRSNGGLLLHGTVSAAGNEDILEVDGGDSCPMQHMRCCWTVHLKWLKW